MPIKMCVIGSGTMGSGIAQTMLVSGFDVVLVDLSSSFLERGVANIEKNLSKLVKKETITEDEKKKIMSRLTTTTDYDDLKNVDVVVEAIVEKMEAKKDLLKKLDSICSENAIFASNTSSLSITEMATASKHPNRVVGMHFFNPVPVMKLVEVIKGEDTDDATVKKIISLCEQMNKVPVLVHEAPGFVVNRILIPMINEAVGVLSEGVASADEIDNAMKMGANHPIGPLALGDLVGLDVCLAIMEVLYNEFSDSKYRPHPLLRKKVRAGHLGRKSGKGFFNYD